MFKTLARIFHKVSVVVIFLLLCLTACQKNGQLHERPNAFGQVLNGAATSKVRIEVFSDLQCPACRNLFLNIIQPVMEEYQDKVSVIYYEFPLNMHQYAYPAARYIAAAAELGPQQVLSVYEAIFTDQPYWINDGNLEDSVSKALSTEDFLRVRQILRDENSLAEINKKIEKEQSLGRRRGVKSTPTLFISYSGKEEKIEGALSYQVIKLFLDPVLK